MRILGCDPGLATFGVALIEVSDGQPTVISMESLISKPGTKKTKMTKADDKLIRLRDLIRWFDGVIRSLSPQVVAAETFSPPRNAGAAATYAMGWGAMAAIVEHYKLPFVHATPQEWRKTLSPKDPREETIHAMITQLAPDKIPDKKADQPHALDATGVALWAVTTDIARALQ